MFLQILVASLIGSVFALVGGVILLTKENFAKRISLVLVSFAVGALLGAAFFDLLPEALEGGESQNIFIFVILGLLALYLFERGLKWYHCHDQEVCNVHTFSTTILVGDAIHNFIDGVVIALSFSLGFEVGVATTIAIFFHEVPQEIGDFGVLLHAGYTKTKVFFYNFLTALTTPIGAVLGYFALPYVHKFLPQMIAFAAGSFIYIAVSDLMPELRHKTKGADLAHLVPIFLGILIIWGVGTFLPE